MKGEATPKRDVTRRDRWSNDERDAFSRGIRPQNGNSVSTRSSRAKGQARKEARRSRKANR